MNVSNGGIEVSKPFSQLIANHWKQKLIAIVIAVVAWWFVNQSINETKTLVGVPIRIINLQPNKTIDGLLPNGILKRRATITVSGTKKVIESLEPGDIEVILDADNAPNEWLVQISKKNIISLNPNIDLSKSIKSTSSQEFIIKLSKFVTTKVPIEVEQPVGNIPRSYMFLGIWPEKLMQTLSGPEEQVEKVKLEGLELIFNLNNITKEDLASLKPPETGAFSDDVIYFKVPTSWKKVYIPFLNPPFQPINDPNAEQMWIEFLRKKFIPLETPLPIHVYYPTEHLGQVNPKTFTLQTNELIDIKDGIPFLNMNVYAYEVSQLFIQIVKDYIEISIIALPQENGTSLKWSVEFIQPQILENRYVAFLSKQYRENSPHGGLPNASNEEQWRNRFRNFMQKLRLYKSRHQRLELDISINNHNIVVKEK